MVGFLWFGFVELRLFPPDWFFFDWWPGSQACFPSFSFKPLLRCSTSSSSSSSFLLVAAHLVSSVCVIYLFIQINPSLLGIGRIPSSRCIGSRPSSGAPTFLLLGRLISLLSFGNTSLVAPLINHLCGNCSGFSVMFCFWIITYIGKEILYYRKGEESDKANMYAVFGAGIVGAMAYTFCDSLWFSAVEGIVWAMSSFFTLAIFWCATKWDREASLRDSFHWIILIGFLIGLSIGVHLLNLLAIPAMGFLFYFKYYKPSFRGIVIASLISLGITGASSALLFQRLLICLPKQNCFL